ncbi:LysR family transcriptional regulator [Paenibacillus sp. GSMTC-2017]|uniref:LysR family transcriptional regulator n=1 Tax=Paenibacillus sp. GSMTC-2017 TaxID=2794350 RepID=UPI0018D889D0|nr:LysR family transcriptional regulator [Paenibacillus sp. GSMTC-2017]MBH5320166.1 LysR family transcriptional regulator [Paenibacillus sp. GSMTC-2017]
MINYELYRVFYWAAKTGSLTQAAKALYITQPSVSHAIKQLEQSFSTTLFARGSRGVELTSEGKMLFSYVEPAFNYLNMAEMKMEELKNLEGGELRIGGSDSLFKHYLLPYLETFHQQHPSVQVHLLHGTTPEIVAYLKEGKIDLGIARMPIADAQLEVQEGISLQDIFVGGPKYDYLKGKTLTLEQLLAHPIVMFSRTSHSRTAITKLFHEQGYALEPEFELGSVDLLIEFAKKGLGISFVTKEFVTKELENGELFEIKLDRQLPPTQVAIITLKQMPLSKAALSFVDQLDL